VAFRNCGGVDVAGLQLDQHVVRSRLARRHGCALAALPLMPEQHLLTDPAECRRFFAGDGRPRDPRAQTWFLKQASGAYKSLHAGHGIWLHPAANVSALRARFGGCAAAGPGRDDYILQAEV
jgi:hypothetical protein